MDRVCERHFNKEDIQTTWDHVINGELLQMERGKPKLKSNAIPSNNLPTEDQYKITNAGVKYRVLQLYII